MIKIDQIKLTPFESLDLYPIQTHNTKQSNSDPHSTEQSKQKNRL